MCSENDAELEALCRSCGLCCDGSLFGGVILEADELRGARKNHLYVLPRGNAFEQPCSALSTRSDGCECSIYSDRPRACRAFTCRLYDRHRRDRGRLEVRLEAVRRVRALLRLLETTDDAEARSAAIAELTQRIEDDFARVASPAPPTTQWGGPNHVVGASRSPYPYGHVEGAVTEKDRELTSDR
jgi:Fe-S-cluster containining protein